MVNKEGEASGAYADRACVDGAYVGGACVDGACIDGTCVDGACVDGVCVGGVCVDGACGDGAIVIFGWGSGDWIGVGRPGRGLSFGACGPIMLLFWGLSSS